MVAKIHQIFITQKEKRPKTNSKYFYELLNTAFYEKTMENVQNRLLFELIKKDEYKEIIKQESKLTFNGTHKSYENCDIYTLKQSEVNMDKPIYLGFAILEMSKLHMYETYYDKYNPILDKIKYNYIIWILIASV